MAKLGFLGLGIMGGPMARQLAGAGHTLSVWSHNQSKARQLATSVGASFCESPEAVAKQSECVFLCVGEVNDITVDSQHTDHVEVDYLTEPTVFVSYQLLDVIQANINDDPSLKHDW